MNPCILLPTYNDRGTIAEMVASLLQFQYPVIIVNDGSDEETRSIINALADSYETVTAVHRSTNGGKGAAVADGIAKAFSLGCSHAIQLDADNQHCVDDIPRFVAAAKDAPHALIMGTPVFGPDVPRARLIGRRISCFWVVLETLSFSIKDPLFGFRMYPVTETHALLSASRIGLRMDFDPEIAVRLYWKGLEVVSIPSAVRYPEGGVSRFRLFEDNVRISWMHTRLFIGMFFRLPRLVRRWF